MNRYNNYIGGVDVPAADGRTFTAFNPTTGDVWGTFALAAAPEVDRAVKAASVAFRTGPWGKLSPTRRGRLLMKWGEVIARQWLIDDGEIAFVDEPGDRGVVIAGLDEPVEERGEVAEASTDCPSG